MLNKIRRLKKVSDWLEQHESAKERIRELFHQDPELSNSDKELYLRILKEASGEDIDVDPDDLPAPGTVTRASRKLRREEGYERLADEATTDSRDAKEEAMSSLSSSDDDRVIWD